MVPPVHGRVILAVRYTKSGFVDGLLERILVMAQRKQKKQGLWKKRLRKIAKKVFKSLLKLTRLAFKHLRRLIRHIWKAWRRSWKKHRGRRKRSEPLTVPGTLVLGAVVLILASASMKGQGQDAACVLRETLADPAMQHRWSEVRQWCPLIMQASERYQLDPYLIAAVMWVESAGNPQAYSHSGAVGLMQVMPRDGIAAGFWCPNGPCFASRPSIAELREPAFNVDYGSGLLADNITRLGTWRDGLRAYGPKDVGYSYADSVLAVYEQLKR